jgi:hypothetical protein
MAYANDIIRMNLITFAKILFPNKVTFLGPGVRTLAYLEEDSIQFITPTP